MDKPAFEAIEDGHSTPEFDAKTLNVDEKRLIRKCDIRILPWLSLLYLLSFLDRTNIGNANLFGLRVNLGMTVTEYSACLAVFFAFYILFEGQCSPRKSIEAAWD
ncbi:hypothetical protein EMMF5_001106 [Cystobasidiomycetes sp. EMM_F5]